MNHIILTTSFPAFQGDASGHFVESEARQLTRDGHVSILAAGRGQSDPAPNCEVAWLGGANLFGPPGALIRLRQRPWALLELPIVVWRAAHLLRDRRGRMWAHWIVPFGFVAALVQNARSGRDRFESLTVIAHGSDVRVLVACPRWVRVAIFGVLLRAKAHVRFVSTHLRDELLSSLPGSLAREVELHSSVEPTEVSVALATKDRREARALLKLESDGPVVLFVGRLIPGKRPSQALAAACLIPRAQIYCLGEGPERARLAASFPEVTFLGQLPRPDCLRWMAGADVLISTSRREGSPVAVREALALGMLVVASPAGDLSERTSREPELYLVDRPSSEDE